MERSTRPLTEKQIGELRGLVAAATTIFRAVLFVLGGLLVARLSYVLTVLLGADAGSWWYLLPTAAVMLGLYLWAGRWTGGAKLRRLVRRDLAGGQASVLRVEAVSAVEIEEVEDEGPGFLVSTSSGETILFAGQYLDLSQYDGFPWHEFEIVEAPRSGLFLGLERLAEPLPVGGVRGPLSFEQMRDLGGFDRNYVVLDERDRALLDQS